MKYRALICITLILLSGCKVSNEDDKEGPKATIFPDYNTVIDSNEAIVITFDEPISSKNISFTGDLNEDGFSRQIGGNVLTLIPNDYWSGGKQRNLSIKVQDMLGNKSTIKLVLNFPLIFKNFQAADIVIGQADFNAKDLSGPSASSIGYLYGNVFSDGKKLFIADHKENRVLVFNDIPLSNQMPADFVIGQKDFNSGIETNKKIGMNSPQMVATNNTQFFVVEYGNSRVLVYNQKPTGFNVLPDFVLGQQDWGQSVAECDAQSLSSPETIVATDNKVLVTDSANNRVLIWDLPITQNAQLPNLVLGQADFDTCAPNHHVTLGSLRAPTGIWSDGDKVVVVDNENNRVLIWNEFPTKNNALADVIIGQSAKHLTAGNDNDQDGVSDYVSASTLFYPYGGVHSNGKQLCIADRSNNRVLIWREIPKNNFKPADIVIGQPDMLTRDKNIYQKHGRSARTLSSPTGCYFHDSKLFVSDDGNGRVLIYNSF